MSSRYRAITTGPSGWRNRLDPSRPPGRCPGPVRIGSAVACAVVDRDLETRRRARSRGDCHRGVGRRYTLGMAKKNAKRPENPGEPHPGRPRRRRYPGARHPGCHILYRQVREIIEQARATAARSVNTEMVRAYWLVGREVVEEEQEGSARAGYGDELIDQLSARLRAEFGRGYNSDQPALHAAVLSRLSPTCLPARFITQCVTNRGKRQEKLGRPVG